MDWYIKKVTTGHGRGLYAYGEGDAVFGYRKTRAEAQEALDERSRPTLAVTYHAPKALPMSAIKKMDKLILNETIRMKPGARDERDFNSFVGHCTGGFRKKRKDEIRGLYIKYEKLSEATQARKRLSLLAVKLGIASLRTDIE